MDDFLHTKRGKITLNNQLVNRFLLLLEFYFAL